MNQAKSNAMTRLFLIFTLIGILSGCGMYNKVFKHKVTSSELTESSHSEKIEGHLEITDKSITTITEKLDTTIKTLVVKGEEKRKVNLEAISNGLNTIDDEFINLAQIYNPVDSTLTTKYTLKPQKVVVPMERKTEV